MLSNQLHLLAELYTLKTSTLKQRSEVDVRVAQELKNDKDFKYETNQSLQTLARGISALSEKHDKVQANSHSDRKALLIEFENLRESVLDSMKEMDQRLGDVETKMFEVLDSFTDLREEYELRYLTKQEFYDAFVPEVKALDDIQQKMIKDKDYFNFALSTLKNQFKQDIQVVKEDLTPKIPEVDPIKAQLDERFKVFKVDFDGLVREIGFLKKAVAYDQKKFEHIYTLIERLKEGDLCLKKA
jgi:hypothetical protein